MAEVETGIEVGTSLRQALTEVGAAWKAAAAGQPVEPTDFTPKRFEMIRHLRREPADGIRALARSLKRDFKNVHADVVALESLGLIKRDPETGKSPRIWIRSPRSSNSRPDVF